MSAKEIKNKEQQLRLQEAQRKQRMENGSEPSQEEFVQSIFRGM
jgi:hypothetical protein